MNELLWLDAGVEVAVAVVGKEVDAETGCGAKVRVTPSVVSFIPAVAVGNCTVSDPTWIPLGPTTIVCELKVNVEDPVPIVNVMPPITIPA
jgi:hypothetical protein